MATPRHSEQNWTGYLYNKPLEYALYVCEGRAGGLEWNGERKPKMANQYPYQMKTRWVKKIEKEGMNGR